MYTYLHVNYPILLSDLNQIGILSTDFRKIHKILNLIKSVQWEGSLEIRTDRQVDRLDEANSYYSFFSWDVIYLLTAFGLSPGGSTHLHTNNT